MPVPAAALVRFFAGPPLPFVTAWRHRVAGNCLPHAHECLEIVFHRRGHGTTAGTTGTIAFAEGGAVIHPPLMPHDQRMDAVGEDICIHLRASRPLPPALRRPLHIPAVRDARLRDEIAALAAAPRGGIALALRANAVLAALACAAAAAAPAAGDADADGVMTAARAFMADRFRDPVAVAEIARHVGLSPDHLRHRFARAHGMGLVAWLRALRVAHAKELLAHAPLPLAEVARLCGFGTDRYLSEVFRRAAGMTPGEFRESKRVAAR